MFRFYWLFELWRRRGDSNPRDPFEPNGFQDRRFQPLTHSSGSNSSVFPEIPVQEREGGQRFRIEPRLKVRIGRLAKVLSIFGPATEATDNSRGFFEGGSGSATPFEGFTSRKIAMKIPGASRSVGRGGAKNLRATCRRGPPHW